jgi:hypothetical protein
MISAIGCSFILSKISQAKRLASSTRAVEPAEWRNVQAYYTTRTRDAVRPSLYIVAKVPPLYVPEQAKSAHEQARKADEHRYTDRHWNDAESRAIVVAARGSHGRAPKQKGSPFLYDWPGEPAVFNNADDHRSAPRRYVFDSNHGILPRAPAQQYLCRLRLNGRYSSKFLRTLVGDEAIRARIRGAPPNQA